MMIRKKCWPWLLLLMVVGVVLWLSSRRSAVQAPSLNPETNEKAMKPERENRVARPWLNRSPAFFPYASMGKTIVSEFDHGSEQHEDFVLSGRVTSQAGDPLPGAIVSVHAPRKAPAYEWPTTETFQTCNSDGRYMLRVSSAIPNASVSVRKEGYATVEGRWNMTAERNFVRNYVLKKAPACLEGTVLDPEGKPVESARVAAGIIMSDSMGIDYFVDATAYQVTEAAGRFAFGGLPAARVSVSASAQHFLKSEKNVTLLGAGPCQRVDFRMQPANTIVFAVKNRRGEAIAEPKYSMGTMGGGGDETGKIELALSLESKPFEFVVSARGYKVKVTTLDPRDPPSEIVLEDTDSVLKGRVISEGGIPVQGARVVVIGTAAPLTAAPALAVPGAAEGMVESDEDGRFSMPLSYPPILRITATKRGYAEYNHVFDGKPLPMEMEIRLLSASSGIFGRVLDEAGKSIRRFSVIAWDAFAPGRYAFRREFDDDNGQFLVTDIPAGIYRVKFQAAEGYWLRSTVLDNLEIRPGYFYGEIQVRLVSSK